MMRLVSIAALAAGLAVTGSTPTLADPVADVCMSNTVYSDATCACVAAKALDLSDGQYDLLLAAIDNKVNTAQTYRDDGLTLADAAKVNGFIWTTAPSCIAERL